jgi:Cu(I)/Ag(I) efflux system membrane protein CusA/SilA
LFIIFLLLYLNFRSLREAEGLRFTRDDLRESIMSGAVERVRPKVMTVAAIMAGLLPIMWSSGTGSEVMQRIAAPMIGGMVSSTILTLVVIPAIYALVQGTAVRWPRSALHPNFEGEQPG